jgi:hypothetical protein
VSGAAGSQSGGKRQLQRQDSVVGPRESEGWDANLPPMHPELMEAHLVVDASHEVSGCCCFGQCLGFFWGGGGDGHT